MTDLKISTRLTALLGGLCVLVLLIGIEGLWGMHQSNQGLRTVYEDRVIPLGQLKTVSDLYAVHIVIPPTKYAIAPSALQMHWPHLPKHGPRLSAPGQPTWLQI